MDMQNGIMFSTLRLVGGVELSVSARLTFLALHDNELYYQEVVSECLTVRFVEGRKRR